MQQITELDHVALHVLDVERSVKFYTEIVGLTPMQRPAFRSRAWLRIAGNQSLHIIAGADASSRALASRGNHFAMAIASMPEAEAHLRAHGITFTGPHHRPDGALQVFFQDPDGHTIEMCVPPQRRD